MFRIVVDIILPIILGIILVVEIMIPSFVPSLPYFWFIKSFKKKPKAVADAERELNQAMKNMEALKNASETDRQVAELRVKEAQEAIDRIKGKETNSSQPKQ